MNNNYTMAASFTERGLLAGGRILRRAVLLLCIGMPAVTWAQDGAALFDSCVACHGANGEGNSALGAPALAGQLESYLQRQLQMFRQGVRGAVAGDSYGAQMQPFARQLADDDAVAALASYLAALPPAPVSTVGAGDPRRGATLYNGNCGACHGGSAEGNAALQAPRLQGLDRAYVKRQLAHYREGRRGSDARDRLGRQMAMMANTLTDETSIDDVLSYIETLEASAAGSEG